MANTTNFGWETPDDTDLVKDGAAAMRTLGNSIDASFVDLKGGTTGQILSKNSNTDLDYLWINNDQGDITAVTAGTGLSGGGTSGDVTLTNTVATAFDAKGDLVVGTGADTFARLAVGTNDYILTAASGETTGLKWVAPSSLSWTTWTPTYSNLTIGNGTVVARYAYSGGLVILQWQLTWGSTSSWSGAASISNLPYNTKNRGAAIGHLQAANVNRPFFISWGAAASSVQIYAIEVAGTYAGQTAPSSTIPGSWSSGSGDYLGIYMVYEAN